MGIVSQKLRDSAKGQPCMFQIPGICQPNNETVCLCHLPSDIKGMGNKSDDFHAAFGCHSCHQAIDLHRLSKESELFYSMRALQRTMRNWVARGLVIVPTDTARPKPLSKTVARRHIATGKPI
jgi:hypothetical protein